MGVMIILLGASLCVGGFFLFAFLWSVKAGQMDDTISPAHKIFFDDTPPTPQKYVSHKGSSDQSATQIK
jgi:cbb3-type cytochrome oxidase maturation protein